MRRPLIALVVFLLILVPTGQSEAGYVGTPTREQITDYATRTAELFDLSPELVLAVIETESDFNIYCKSSAGCLGLMQLNPNTGKWCCEQMGMKYDPYDYQTNIAMGCYYLDSLRREWMKFDVSEEDCVFYVLISYNRGVTGANKWLQSHDLYENGYANKVLRIKRELEEAKYLQQEQGV